MSADFNFSFLTATEANYAQAILDLVAALALGLDTTVSNPPSGAIRWSSTNSRWEKYNGTSWVALSSLYNINADTLDGVHAAGFATASHNHSGVYQPLDAELTALAGLASAADKLGYFTGSGTAALTTLTAIARSLLACSSVADMRTLLGAQASDATLTALAAVTTASDRMIYATGSDQFATTALTAAARSILAATTIAAMRDVLGLGSAALLTAGTAANNVVQLDSSARLPAVNGSLLTGFGTASKLNVGTSANNVVQLDSSARLPAVDGSQLTGITAGLAACTAAEAIAGTIDTKAITPLKLRNGLNASGSAPIFAIRAFVACDGSGNLQTSGNVTSVTVPVEGRFTVNFTTAMPVSQYVITCQGITSEGAATFNVVERTTTSFTVQPVYSGTLYHMMFSVVC